MSQDLAMAILIVAWFAGLATYLVKVRIQNRRREEMLKNHQRMIEFDRRQK